VVKPHDPPRCQARQYYRWSYRRLKEDDTPLEPLGLWTQLTRQVVAALRMPGSWRRYPDTSDPGPAAIVGSESNLFEIGPAAFPAGGIEWTIVG